jgi:hypothetical protein
MSLKRHRIKNDKLKKYQTKQEKKYGTNSRICDAVQPSSKESTIWDIKMHHVIAIVGPWHVLHIVHALPWRPVLLMPSSSLGTKRCVSVDLDCHHCSTHTTLCVTCVKPSPCERKSITTRVECAVHVWISFVPLSSYFLIVPVLFVSILTRIHDPCSYRLEQHASGDDTE